MRVGDVVEHYRLERYLGAGAFATVWLARDEYLDDPVAIKVLADNWARDDDVRRRFIDEARIMRRIDHPRIVRVFTVRELASGQPMFVMTFADQGTLSEVIRDRKLQAQRFTTDEIVEMTIELAECLAVVHDFGIVHRDLKPSNVLYRTPRRHEPFDPDRPVMLLGDFGLAKDTIARSGFTMAAGTPAYMPPEQARATSELDHRADIYAATAILFELLTGRAPFDASTLSDVQRDRSERRAVLDIHRSGLSAGWQEIIDRGLAAEPSQRYDSARELAEAVAEMSDAGRSAIQTSSLRGIGDDGHDDRPGGLCGAVDDVLRRFGAERSAAIDRRVREPVVIALADGVEPGPAVISQIERIGATVVRLAAVDARVGDVDLVVVSDATDRAQLKEALTDAPAGPVAIVDHTDVALEHAIELVDRRSDAIRASAALAQLDDDVRRAGSMAMSESWMTVRETVESLRFDVPAFVELRALRAETAGRVILPADARASMRRLLFEVDTAARLGRPADTPDGDLLDAALVQLGEWRGLQDSGRVGFTSREPVEVVVRCLERLWAGLSRYS